MTAATQVDHILALELGGTEEESNLQPICDECHKKKTAADFGHHPWPTVGNDGWPVDSRQGKIFTGKEKDETVAVDPTKDASFIIK